MMGELNFERASIYQKIIDVMSDVGAIGKDKKVQAGSTGYNYRGVDQVMNALQPVIVKHGIFITPEILDERREDRTSAKGGNLVYTVLKIKYYFYAADGSYITATVIGEGMDSGDKSANKAMSVAYKYACFQVFSIPTEEMVDPDGEIHELAPVAPQKNKKTEKDPSDNSKPSEYVTQEDRTLIVAEFKKCVGDSPKASKENEELYTSILKKFGASKTPELKKADVPAVLEYIHTLKNIAA